MNAPLRRDDLCQVMEAAVALVRGRSPSWHNRKAAQDYVTDLDLVVDEFLQQALSALQPGVPVLSEERAADRPGPIPAFWIVDPIDGTHNLMARVPFVGISVALVDAKGPCFGAVASMTDGTLWVAARGEGAWEKRAGQPMRPLLLPREAPSELLVLSTGLLDALMAEGGGRWPALRRLGKLRNLGAQALHLCGVAAGQFAAAGSIEARIWDEAAGGLILREAGGIWASAADAADWQDPAALMEVRQLRSLACHPAVAETVSAILHGLLTPLSPGMALASNNPGQTRS